MQKMPGYTVVEETEDILVLERYFPPENGKPGCHVRITGNPHPDPVAHQKAIDDIYNYLLECRRRREALAAYKDLDVDENTIIE